jgi:hypothetical protein
MAVKCCVCPCLLTLDAQGIGIALRNGVCVLLIRTCIAHYPKDAEDDDVWDDSALVKAYDQAVQSFKMGLRTPGSK